MKKITLIVLALTLGCSAVAFACPSGEHPVGGFGHHHSGGTCVWS